MVISQDFDGLFDELDHFGRTSVADVIDSFLNSETDGQADPIRYWLSNLDRPGAKITPRGALARMALDFLSAPGMIVFLGTTLVLITSASSHFNRCRTSFFTWRGSGW